MHDGVCDSFDRFKGSVDEVLAALAEDLDMDVLRYHLPVRQLAKEIILDLGCRREADLDLLEAEFQQQLEELHLFLDDHGFHQGLVAVTQVDGTPDRGFLDLLIRPGALREVNDGVPLISFDMVHNVLLKTIDLYSVMSVWHFAGKI